MEPFPLETRKRDARMRIARRIVPLCALLLAAGCASQPKLPPRVTLEGFSLARPDGEEWKAASRTPTQVTYGKAGYTGETFALQAGVARLPAFKSGEELLRYVEAAQRKELEAARLRILRLEVKPQDVQGEPCALARVAAAERAESGNSPARSTRRWAWAW